jgi:hypothetical protein
MPNFPIDPPLRLLVAFQQRHADAMPDLVFNAPDRELWLAARYVPEPTTYTLVGLDDGMTAPVTFTLQSAKLRQTVLRRPLPRWARYPAGVLLATAEFDLPSFDAVICGDEPPGPRYEYGLGLLFAGLVFEYAGIPHVFADLTAMADGVRRTYVE